MRGYHVIVNRAGTAPLDMCSVSGVRPGQTFSRMDSGSGAPGANDDIVTHRDEHDGLPRPGLLTLTPTRRGTPIGRPSFSCGSGGVVFRGHALCRLILLFLIVAGLGVTFGLRPLAGQGVDDPLQRPITVRA